MLGGRCVETVVKHGESDSGSEGTLPARTSFLPSADSPNAPVAAGGDGRLNMGGRLKILLAGAGSVVAEAADKALGHAGLTVEVVRVDDGGDAVQALGKRIYDCVLLDAALPDEDRSAVLSEAGKYGVDTPVILLTEDGGGPGTWDVLEAMAFDCIGQDNLEKGRLSRAVCNAVRVARAERQANLAEQLLAHHTMYDSLTGLPNRILFDDRLKSAISIARREGRQVAVLVIDLDRFGEINKTLGHAVGDTLLAELGSRINQTLRSSDSVARLAGDEFAVLMSTGASLNGAANAAEKIVKTLQEPVVLSGHRLVVGASVGVALFPLHGPDGAAIVRHAGVAMSDAKRNNSGFAVFTYANEHHNLNVMSLANDLRHAVEKAELLLHYQPLIDLKTKRACGAEALLRWQHPQHGLLSPMVFIPLAERTGTIEPLTMWVLDSALAQCDAWGQKGYELPVSVNISAMTLHKPDFSNQVAALLEERRVPAERLKLEITEGAIISDIVRASETVASLHRMGVGISIDDFGVGYTSIANLRRLPVSEVKIDKSYVLNMRHDSGDAFIVCSIIELGHNLGLRVVAEGVEDRETLDMLVDLGCDAMQGFYVSRPIDVASFDAWIAESPWAPKCAAPRAAGRLAATL